MKAKFENLTFKMEETQMPFIMEFPEV